MNRKFERFKSNLNIVIKRLSMQYLNVLDIISIAFSIFYQVRMVNESVSVIKKCPF